jgi:hypothetical protein
MLLTCEPAELRNPAAALASAAQAVEKSAGRDPRSLHILAQAYRQSGQAQRAAATEQRASALEPSPQK